MKQYFEKLYSNNRTLGHDLFSHVRGKTRMTNLVLKQREERLERIADDAKLGLDTTSMNGLEDDTLPDEVQESYKNIGNLTLKLLKESNINEL